VTVGNAVYHVRRDVEDRMSELRERYAQELAEAARRRRQLSTLRKLAVLDVLAMSAHWVAFALTLDTGKPHLIGLVGGIAFGMSFEVVGRWWARRKP
jgi:hypothetical protein